ncbi:hypothetical protein Lysil_2131 [Lysobacter silvestris]|uniref:Uncharacterized protein n=1 Tax=Solilutibacter silvestris TaxID=1645665 RepID=A0A2K1PYT2_9GAMM|nr:hypothetical protein Lysil_2131 [Lysobacter silvestris]
MASRWRRASCLCSRSRHRQDARVEASIRFAVRWQAVQLRGQCAFFGIQRSVVVMAFHGFISSRNLSMA